MKTGDLLIATFRGMDRPAFRLCQVFPEFLRNNAIHLLVEHELAGLSVSTSNALRAALYLTQDDLRAASDEELAGLRGIGDVRLAEIRAWLREVDGE